MWTLRTWEIRLYSLELTNYYCRESLKTLVNYYLSNGDPRRPESYIDLSEEKNTTSLTETFLVENGCSLTEIPLLLFVYNAILDSSMCWILVTVHSYVFPMTNEQHAKRSASNSGLLIASSDSVLFIQMHGNSTRKFNNNCLSKTLECRLVIIHRPVIMHKTVHSLAHLFGIIALLCYTSIITCVPSTVHAFPEIDTFPDGLTQDQVKGHCVDSNGTLRGLFSTWVESPDCRCTCYPAARMAVSVCDGCIVVPPEVQTKLREQVSSAADPTENFKNLPKQGNSLSAKRSDCVYAQTGIHYQHSEIWMSAKTPCVKCRCEDGTVSCAGQPHHCPPSCLPGQQTVSVGPCCEATCKGKALQNLSINLASCMDTKTGATHAHGEMIISSGSCVDQKCQCVNGRWNCLDYCVPLTNLPCPPQSATVWDPFCCPRCQGTLKCTVPNFNGSIHDDTDQKHAQTVKLSTDNVNESKPHDRASDELFHDTKGLDNNEVPNPMVLVVDPGAEVALQNGHCYCLNATIYCPRPGRHVWHDEDCYFVDGTEGTYYSPNTSWIPNGDACTECRCLKNRQYVCEPKKCAHQFLCPNGEQPLIRAGECCPSSCGVRPKNDGLSKPTVTQLWEAVGQQKPESIGKSSNQHSNSIENSMSANMLNKESGNSYIKNGCPGLGGSNDPQRDIFPTGSRLVLSRPCRSLLCICASDHRWMCSDYCPSCTMTLESVDTTNSFPIPPAGKCCPVCNTAEAPVTRPYKESKPVDGKSINERSEFGGSADDRIHSGFFYPISDRHMRYEEGIHQSPYRIPVATSDQIERTLKLYVLIAAVVLFCLLGFPVTIFITWYAITRKRKRIHQEYRVKLRRRRQQRTEAMATAVRQHPSFVRMMTDYRGYQSTTTSDPSTSSSQDAVSPFILGYHNVPSSARCEEVCEQRDGLDSSFKKIMDRGKAAINVKEPQSDSIRPVPRVSKRTVETKSVPSSPVARFATRPKPRRVRSNAKDNGSPKIFYNKTPESISQFDDRRLSHIEDENAENMQPTVSTKAVPLQINRLDVDRKVSVRRAMSTIATRQSSFDQPVGSKLSRASTWLPGARTPSHIFGLLSRQVSQTSDVKDDSNSLSNRLEPSEIASASPEHGCADSSKSGRQTEKEKMELVVQTTRSCTTTEANKKQWARSNSQVRIIRPDTLLRSILRAQTVSEGKEYVRHHSANYPRNAASQAMSNTKEFDGAGARNDSNISRSPETDNTSMTDSQSPLLLPEKTSKIVEPEEQQLRPILDNLLSSTPTDRFEASYCDQVDRPSHINPLHRETPPQGERLAEGCYTWPRPRPLNDDTPEHQA